MVTEPDEFFDMMIKIMRDTREEGMFTLHTVKCDTKRTYDVILIYFFGNISPTILLFRGSQKNKTLGQGCEVQVGEGNRVLYSPSFILL